MEFMEMLGENGIPFGIVFTKSDKLSKNQLAYSVEGYKERLLEQWEELPPIFITSSEKRVGREEILDFIGGCIDDMQGIPVEPEMTDSELELVDELMAEIDMIDEPQPEETADRWVDDDMGMSELEFAEMMKKYR